MHNFYISIRIMYCPFLYVLQRINTTKCTWLTMFQAPDEHNQGYSRSLQYKSLLVWIFYNIHVYTKTISVSSPFHPPGDDMFSCNYFCFFWIGFQIGSWLISTFSFFFTTLLFNLNFITTQDFEPTEFTFKLVVFSLINMYRFLFRL